MSDEHADRIFQEKTKYGLSLQQAIRNIAKEDLLTYVDSATDIEDIKKALRVLINEVIK